MKSRRSLLEIFIHKDTEIYKKNKKIKIGDILVKKEMK